MWGAERKGVVLSCGHSSWTDMLLLQLLLLLQYAATATTTAICKPVVCEIGVQNAGNNEIFSRINFITCVCFYSYRVVNKF